MDELAGRFQRICGWNEWADDVVQGFGKLVGWQGYLGYDGAKRVAWLVSFHVAVEVSWLVFPGYLVKLEGFAGLVGLVQGGVQSVSRTIFSRLIPQEKATEFFGFYNLIGKSAVVVGPALVGWMAYIFNNPKAGIISLLILFIPGIIILFYVPRTSLVRD